MQANVRVQEQQNVSRRQLCTRVQLNTAARIAFHDVAIRQTGNADCLIGTAAVGDDHLVGPG